MTRGTRPSRRRLRNTVAVAGLAIVAIGAMSPGAASRTSVVRHQGLPVSARPDRVLGPTPPAERIEFDLILRYRRRALRRFTTGVNDPASPDYHRYASAAELGRRFGVSSHELDRVRLWLREHGLDVVADYPQRTAFRVAGPTSLVDHALGVTMVDRRDRRTGVRYHQPRGPARVPMELTGTVALVDGLDTKPRFYRRPLAAPRQAGTHCADTPSCLTIDKLNRAFAITPLHDRGFRGEGQYVAVVMDGKVSQSDLDAFSAASGLTDVPPIETITVGAGPTAEELADPIGRYEATMDVETVQAIAPRARLLYFFAALQNFRGAIDAVVADGRAKIVTFSAGACDNGHSRGADDTALEAANGHGINVFASSGDAGAFTCLQGNPNDFRPFATDPADSPFVTGVGGTFLRYTANGTYVDETVWAGPLDNSGTGGGLAFAPQRPAWNARPGSTMRTRTANDRCQTSRRRRTRTADGSSSSMGRSSSRGGRARVRRSGPGSPRSFSKWCSRTDRRSSDSSTPRSTHWRERTLRTRSSTTSCAATTSTTRPHRDGTSRPAWGLRSRRGSATRSSPT